MKLRKYFLIDLRSNVVFIVSFVVRWLDKFDELVILCASFGVVVFVVCIVVLCCLA
jgi:hypothetical protein